MAENGPREDIAKIVSEKLLSIFKWKQYGPYDQDFPCRKQQKHLEKDKTQKHTHPVDVVFGYKDPYSNKNVLLNTDLKSYGEGTINSTMVEDALISLAKLLIAPRTAPIGNENTLFLLEIMKSVDSFLFTIMTTSNKKSFMNFLSSKKRERTARQTTKADTTI